MQKYFIQPGLRTLAESLATETKLEYEFRLNRRIIMYICFLVLIFLGYLVLWLPFVNRLSKEMWRTKSMLMIIPVQVIIKNERIRDYLFNNDYINNKWIINQSNSSLNAKLSWTLKEFTAWIRGCLEYYESFDLSCLYFLFYSKFVLILLVYDRDVPLIFFV